MIEIKNVTKIIKNNTVLENINLKINDGEMMLLRGHNGCGKTMLLRLIAGFIKPTVGEVKKNDSSEIGVIIENPSFFLEETAFYNLKYLADIRKKITDEEILSSMKQLGLFEYRNNKVKTFSLGMKQRLALCQAFMENPDIILLDEPFNAIDDENVKKVVNILNKLKSKGKIIVIASHGDIKECSFDKVIKMSNGKIVEEKIKTKK